MNDITTSLASWIATAAVDFCAGRAAWNDSDTRPISQLILSRPGEGKSHRIEHDLPTVLEDALLSDIGDNIIEDGELPECLVGNHVHWSERCNVCVITDLASTRDAPDIKGFMVPRKDGTSEYLVPDMIVMERAAYAAGAEIVILFLDEVLGVDHLTQKALTDVFLNGRFGRYSLRPTTWVIGASNRQSDGAGVNRALTILTNRINVINVETTIDEWISYAMEHRDLPPMLLSFAKQFPGMCVVESPPKEGPFPTFRSLTFAGEWITAYKRAIGDKDALSLPLGDGHEHAYAKVSGFIGETVATKLAAYARIANDVPRIEEILRDPEGAKVPPETRLDAAYVIAQTCVYYANAKNAAKLFDYIARLPGDMQSAALKQMIDKGKTSKSAGNISGVLTAHPPFGEWVRNNSADIGAILAR